MKLPSAFRPGLDFAAGAGRVRGYALQTRAALAARRTAQRLRAWRPFAPLALGLLSALLTLLTLRLASTDASWSRAFSTLLNPRLFLANWLPVLLCALTLYYALGRPWLAFLLTALPVLGLALVNYYKLLLRGDPLLFADLGLVGEASAMSRRYAIRPTLETVEGALVTLGMAALLWVFFRRAPKPAAARRATGCAVCAAALWGCLQILVTSDALYAATGLAVPWLPTQSYTEHGVVYPFLRSAAELRNTPPEGYDEHAAAAALAAYGEDAIPAQRRVDVIGVMLEAFGDFTTFDNLDFTADPYADLRAIQAESYTGELVVNVFAGETVNTERAFLTGYLDPTDNFREPVNSFVWYFRRQGYACIGAHPGYNWFYNRLNVNDYLGFSQYQFYESRYYRYNPPDGITPDRQFFPTIVSDYNAAKATGKPVFSFNVSYQNHGPYDTAAEYATAYLPWRDGYNADDYHIANNYLSGVAETCRQLRALVDHFRTEARPVVLVLFGDHKPWWGDHDSTYAMFGLNLDCETEEGFYHRYTTPYLIWANDAARARLGDVFRGDGGRLGPSFLMERLFTLAGWGGPAYLKALRALEAHTPFVNRQYCLDFGTLTASAGSSAPAWLTAFRSLEYYQQHSAVAGAT